MPQPQPADPMMRATILSLIRRVAGTTHLHAELLAQREVLAAIRARLGEAAPATAAPGDPAPGPAAGSLPMLPGTPYSTVAIPLEYPPSRAPGPRWGRTQPILEPVAAWMRPHAQEYRAILAAMSANAPQLARIRRDFDPALLPEPAWCGVPFAPFDSAALYTIIGQTRPATYLEIGSGITTAFAHRAIRDHGLATRILSIDPEPRAAIDGICDEVIRQGLESCDLAIFDQLQAGDVLFLDGSHRVFMNSDVTVFMLDVLPRLKPGVLVHVHDIPLPWDYPDMFTDWYWSEAYILAAYIIGAAARLRPVFPTAWVCRQPEFEDWFATPLVDLGAANDGWRGGGSLWFTHAG